MINRRNFLKQTAFLSTIPAFNLLANEVVVEKKGIQAKEEIKKIEFFDKSICPLCSIGCHTIIKKETSKNNIIITAIEGDSNSVQNLGELCHKIDNLHFQYNPNIPRIETPLLKMKDGKYSKDGVLSPVSWEIAFNIMEEKTKKSLKENGVDGVGLITSESLSIYESYAISKLFKAGFRSNNITNINYEVEKNGFSLIQTFGIDGSNGGFEDIFASNYFISYGINFRSDYKILLSKLVKQKYIQNDNFTFINIITNEDDTIEEADINFLIKPNSEHFLFNYFINLSLEKITKDDFDFLQNKVIFATFDKDTIADDDKLLQWEVSYHTYKQYFEKFTLDYVLDKIKTDNEATSLFKFKLSLLTPAYTKDEVKTLSYFDSKKDSQAITNNLLIHSLHLISNKYGKSGSGVMYLHNSKLTSTTTVNYGNSSCRLPSGMFTKYKQHTDKAEAIWNIPTNTLNSIASTNPLVTFKKFNDKITKIVWIMGCTGDELEPYYNYLKDVEDSFIVYSNTYFDNFVLDADLILPTASFFEKHIGFENSQREITLSKQHIVPYGESMSELWQTLEFSKRFTPNDTWKNSKIDNVLGLKNILDTLQNFGYTEKTSLFSILFNNNKTKRYKLTSEDFFDSLSLNSEVKGDNRTIFGGDGKLFEGYKFFIQKYLFEELRLFGSGNGYDLASFLEYSSDFYEKWPIIFSNKTKYRFNSSNDTYAKRLSKSDDEFIFYGKLGGKQLPFGDEEKIKDTNLKELKYRAKIFMEKRG